MEAVALPVNFLLGFNSCALVKVFPLRGWIEFTLLIKQDLLSPLQTIILHNAVFVTARALTGCFWSGMKSDRTVLKHSNEAAFQTSLPWSEGRGTSRKFSASAYLSIWP